MLVKEKRRIYLAIELILSEISYVLCMCAKIVRRRDAQCNTYILLEVLLCSIAEYFYELCRTLTSP